MGVVIDAQPAALERPAFRPPPGGDGARAPALPPWDDLVRLAASLADCPIAFVALDAVHGPVLHAHHCAGDDALPPAERLLAHALQAAVDDAGGRARGCCPEACGEAVWIAFSAPLVDARGRALGALCVADARSRRLDAGTGAALAALARVAAAMVDPATVVPSFPASGAPRPGTWSATVAVAILQFDPAGRAPETCGTMMARVERAVETAIGAGDVVSRHDAGELLLVLADPARAGATLERVRRAIGALPEGPRVAVGMAADVHGPVPLEDLFLDAEADLRRTRGRPPVVFVPGSGVA